jgi:hypothetical protein
MHTPRPAIRRAAVAPTALTVALVTAAAPVRAQTAETELGITRYDVHEGVTEHWRLTCDPDGGLHPAAQEACDRLREIDGDLDEIRARPVACPKIFAPVRLEIVGTWRGELKIFEETYPNACYVERLAGPIAPTR